MFKTTAFRRHTSHLRVPKFTVFIPASEAAGLPTTLRAARIAPDTLVIHAGDPVIERLCLRYGARGKTQIPGVTLGAYAMDAFYSWILLLKPGEDLSIDTLSALQQWRKRRHDECAGYLIRDEETGRPQLRLVNRSQLNWIGELPPVPTNAGIFPGAITYTLSRRAA